MPSRQVTQIIKSIPASDGAGVKLRRSLGQSNAARVDPFLMLDEFSSENPDDYVAGFPDHPHRGFETVTYMLDGHMLHQDHLGNRGNLKSGGVQWMTAGRGIIPSEMPEQESGRMRGFQLWINLPALEKMKPAGYRDLQASDIPEVKIPGGKVKLIAGSFGGTTAPVSGGSTDPLYFDVHLEAGATFTQPIKDGYKAFVYPYEGDLSIRDQGLESRNARVLLQNGELLVKAKEKAAPFILLAAKPIGEPGARDGPFLVNTA